MSSPNPGMRKAAILVASLDQAAADAVLDQLTPEQAQEVRRISVDLGDIDSREQQRVMDEFSASVRCCRASVRRVSSWTTVLQDGCPSIRRPNTGKRSCRGRLGIRRISGTVGRSDFCARRETDKLARALGWRAPADHRPGAIAFAAAAGRQRVWRGLQPALQSDVVRRLGRPGRDRSGILRSGRGPRRAAFPAGADAASAGGGTGRRGRHPAGVGRSHRQCRYSTIWPPTTVRWPSGWTRGRLAFDDLADVDQSVLAAVVREGRVGACW